MSVNQFKWLLRVLIATLVGVWVACLVIPTKERCAKITTTSREGALRRVQVKKIDSLLNSIRAQYGDKKLVPYHEFEVLYFNQEVNPAYIAGRKPKTKKEWSDEQKIVGVPVGATQVTRFLHNARTWLDEHPLRALPPELRAFHFTNEPEPGWSNEAYSGPVIPEPSSPAEEAALYERNEWVDDEGASGEPVGEEGEPL